MLDNEAFQRENLGQSYAALGCSEGDPRSALLKEGVRLLPHQVVGVNWMAEMEDGLAGGGLLADDCGTGKVSSS